MNKKLTINLQLFAEKTITMEQLQKDMLDLQENFNNIKVEKEKLEGIVNEKTKREKELEEHNQKLFLKVTSNTNIDKKEEEINEDEQEMKTYVGEKFYNVLSNKEKEQLKIIMNGDDE